MLGFVILGIALQSRSLVRDVVLQVSALSFTFLEVAALIGNFLLDVGECTEFAVESNERRLHPLDFNVLLANGELKLLFLLVNHSNAVVEIVRVAFSRRRALLRDTTGGRSALGRSIVHQSNKNCLEKDFFSELNINIREIK